jgi:hypothetical protein
MFSTWRFLAAKSQLMAFRASAAAASLLQARPDRLPRSAAATDHFHLPRSMDCTMKNSMQRYSMVEKRGRKANVSMIFAALHRGQLLGLGDTSDDSSR